MLSNPGNATLKRIWLLLTAVLLFFIATTLLYTSGSYRRVDRWVIIAKGKVGLNGHEGQRLPKERLPPRPVEVPGFYDWVTKSSFDPVRLDGVANKSVEDLCASFPKHLLEQIQPVLKTGHGVLDTRVEPQLRSVSACLDNLLIFSDVEEDYMGRHIIDVIRDLPAHLRDYESQLQPWRDGSIRDGTVSSNKAWKMDKYKFLPSVSRAWMERPNRSWYVFYEADTYIVWDNVFRLLENFNPNDPHYFGSPTVGRQKTAFANGGMGYIISREAMRRLTVEDYDPEGHYRGSMLAEKHWYNLYDDCCGDSVLGWALVHVNVSLSGLNPMFNPQPPNGVPFNDAVWCKPVISMHKPTTEDLVGLWRWEFEHRELSRPLLYRDLAVSYFDMSHMETRQDWRNYAPGIGFEAPGTFDSADVCELACREHPECHSWTYHLRQCHLVKSIRYGKKAAPEAKGEMLAAVDKNDSRYVAGWDTMKIVKWMEARPCEEIEWLHPSWDRHL